MNVIDVWTEENVLAGMALPVPPNVWRQMRHIAAEDEVLGGDQEATDHVIQKLRLSCRLNVEAENAFRVLLPIWSGFLDDLIEAANTAPAGFIPEDIDQPF
jgi:hypothetical protein